MLDDQAIISRKPSLIAADVADESILLDIDSGYFFQLNRTASLIWGLVETPRPLGEICDAVAADFPGDAAQCRSDAAEFIADLRNRGLIEIANS